VSRRLCGSPSCQAARSKTRNSVLSVAVISTDKAEFLVFDLAA
jgi:hypothetical protein